jgi:hypothetical protein
MQPLTGRNTRELRTRDSGTVFHYFDARYKRPGQSEDFIWASTLTTLAPASAFEANVG